MTGRALVVQADALRLPLRDESVDLVVTSPPYWSLRSYDAGSGEIGSEPTPAEYLEALWAATAEMARVLKPTGSILVDLGDKYASDNRGSGHDPKRGEAKYWPPGARSLSTQHGIPPKSLMLLPERYRIGCVDQLGLIARAVIVWDKPNGLPESVRDRVRRSHEDWVHLTRFPRYYSALDEIRTPCSAKTYTTLESGWGYAPDDTQHARAKQANWNAANGVTRADAMHPLGALPGSVWRIPSEPLRLPDWLGVQHYAAFSSEWPRRLILAFSPPGICVECGEGRWPVVDRRTTKLGSLNSYANRISEVGPVSGGTNRTTSAVQDVSILGYACACTPFTDHPGTGAYEGQEMPYREQLARGSYPQNFGAGSGTHDNLSARPKVGPWREYHLTDFKAPPTRPSVVLDCFGGTGTTALVARALGRNAFSFDLSHAYSRAANWRIFDSGNAGKATARTWAERQGTLA